MCKELHNLTTTTTRTQKGQEIDPCCDLDGKFFYKNHLSSQGVKKYLLLSRLLTTEDANNVTITSPHFESNESHREINVFFYILPTNNRMCSTSSSSSSN